MKIAHVINSYRPGLGYEENHLPFEQSARGDEVSIITSTLTAGSWTTMSGGSEETPPAPGVTDEAGVAICRLPHSFSARRNSQLMLDGLREHLARTRPDVVHVHGPVGALVVQALRTCRALRIPAVLDNHLCYFNLRPYGLVKRAYYRFFRHVMLPRLDPAIGAYVPLEPDGAKLLHRELGVPYERMRESSLGVDTRLFSFKRRAGARVRKELGIPRRSRVIVFVGRITPAKDLNTLLWVWMVLSQSIDVHLLLVGPVSEAVLDDLEKSAPPELAEKLHVTGYVPNEKLPAYLSAANVAVWPGDPGITMLQAMACGLPVVCPESGYVRGQEDFGVAFERGDKDELGKSLVALLLQPEEIASKGRRARTLAREELDWRVVAERTNAIYEEVLAKGRVG